MKNLLFIISLLTFSLFTTSILAQEDNEVKSISISVNDNEDDKVSIIIVDKDDKIKNIQSASDIDEATKALLKKSNIDINLNEKEEVVEKEDFADRILKMLLEDKVINSLEDNYSIKWKESKLEVNKEELSEELNRKYSRLFREEFSDKNYYISRF